MKKEKTAPGVCGKGLEVRIEKGDSGLFIQNVQGTVGVISSVLAVTIQSTSVAS